MQEEILRSYEQVLLRWTKDKIRPIWVLVKIAILLGRLYVRFGG